MRKNFTIYLDTVKRLKDRFWLEIFHIFLGQKDEKVLVKNESTLILCKKDTPLATQNTKFNMHNLRIDFVPFFPKWPKVVRTLYKIFFFLSLYNIAYITNSVCRL